MSEMESSDEKRQEVDVLQKANIDTEFGGHSERVFDADWWVVSPGIALSNPILQSAIERKIPAWSEIEVASWFCRSPIIAVTGSNGKSTTTALLGEIFIAAGIPCVVAGNIGQPFSDFVDKTVPEGVAVLEVSSFQLEMTETFHPKIAIFLNLTPDHLDRHGSMEEYGRLKARIFENQSASDYLIFNGRDSKVVDLTQPARSQRVAFGSEDITSEYGFVKNNHFTVRWDTEYEMILPVNEMALRGEHNIENALAAILAARIMSVGKAAIGKALRTFHGLPHRMEVVRKMEGIEWVNDSKATNIDSVRYALGAFSNPVILIAGGRDKDSDFRALRTHVKEKVRSVVLLGEAAEKIEKAFQGICPLIRVNSLKEAICKARDIAESGDVVLLSPGCASFDMFKNFEDRGDQFKRLVERL